MGSGTSRKPTDAPIIRKPKTAAQISGGTGGQGGGGRSPERIAEVCLPSFETKLMKSSLLKDGEALSLQKEAGGTYNIMLFGQKIGVINKNLSDMVATCDEMGVKYSGKVVKTKKADEFLARFIRR